MVISSTTSLRCMIAQCSSFKKKVIEISCTNYYFSNVCTSNHQQHAFSWMAENILQRLCKQNI